MSYPYSRGRRLRKTESLRRLASETRLSSSDFVYPIFVSEAINEAEAIPSMPGIFRYPYEKAAIEAERVYDLGIPAILLFGLPKRKDATGSESLKADGIIQKTINEIKSRNPDIVVITDVCLCEYTEHGHCGILKDGKVDNDATIEALGRQAVSHAQAGADIVAPSAMMDGQVRAIRNALDENGFKDTAIMAYSAKFSSAFYGPFREAAQSAPQFGDRKSYQMNSANSREALREIGLDIEEGADIVMIKPALAYLDIISNARQAFNLPIAAYNVSGEYSMVKMMAAASLADEMQLALEILTSIKRAGADIIISYHAPDVVTWLAKNGRV